MAEITTRRSILVPIDLRGINRDSLEAVVRIAHQLDRGLLGLLLEDIRLQQVAALPFTTEISMGSGRERNLLGDALSRHHQLVSAGARKVLDELARRDRVELTFESAAGSRLHTALERDGQLDIFFPARQRWQLVAARRPGGPAIRRLGVVLAHAAQDPGVLATARNLLQSGSVGEVYLLCEGPPAQAELDALYRPGSRVCVQSNQHCDPPGITRLLCQSAYDLLLLPRDCLRGIAPQALDAALDKAGGQVLVIT